MESNVVLGRYTLLESRSITFVEISRMGLVDSLEIRQICVERFFLARISQRDPRKETSADLLAPISRPC